jgi:Lamin Tail Domain
MSQGKRLFAYVLLNVLISAATTYGVLSLWSRAHPTPSLPAGLISPTLSSLSLTETVQATDTISQIAATVPAPIPLGQQVISINNVFGIGDLTNEVVLIKSTTDTSLSLTNWRLQDNAGNTYVFPELTLNKGGAVQVHTTAGVNTVIDLFWGRDAAVWQEGKMVVLLDAEGIERAHYTIP